MVQGFTVAASNNNLLLARNFAKSTSKLMNANANDNDNDDKIEGEWNSYSPSDLGVGGTYRLGVSAVIPRPVAVITSTNKDGIVNCAPFSYTGLLSHDPPMVAHGICMDNGKKKDTLVNIETNKEWVFNVLTDSYLEKANACSEALPSDVSEVEKASLSTLPSEVCKTPRLEQAMVSMECELESTKELFNDDGKHTTTVVMGRIVRYHVHSSVLTDDSDTDSPVVDVEKVRAVGRVGGVTYWPAGEGKSVTITRP